MPPDVTGDDRDYNETSEYTGLGLDSPGRQEDFLEHDKASRLLELCPLN